MSKKKKKKRINLKVSYIIQFLCKNLIFGMSTFVLDNNLQTTRHAMHQVFAVFSCNFLPPYAVYCHFEVLSTCEMFINYFVFKYRPQIIVLRSGLLPRQSNVLIFFVLRKSPTNFEG